MNLFFVFFSWFELCFQASFLVARRINFWSSFSLSGLFLEPFVAHVWILFRSFSLICRSWAHFGSAGGQLFHHKNGLDHQRRPSGISPKINSFFWSHFGAFFCDFSGFLRYVFKHRFLLSSEPEFSWMLASFRHHFLILVILVGTSGFSDF